MFSGSALHVHCSCFKNFTFPCQQGLGTILIELKAFKGPKRMHACISSSAADSYLLTSIGQSSCSKILRTFTDTRTHRSIRHAHGFSFVWYLTIRDRKSQP